MPAPWSSPGNLPPVWTNQQILNQLSGKNGDALGRTFFWPGSSITFSFPTNGDLFAGQSELAGFVALSAAQKAMAVIAFALWDELIAPTITQTASSNNSQIVFGNSNISGYAYTSSTYSVSPNNITSAQIWFNKAYDGTTGGAGNDLIHPTIGLHGFATYIHEIGHALGLDHMGAYNGSGLAPDDATSYQDSTVYSIMSYFGPSWGNSVANGLGLVAWADWVGADGKLYDPQTPMLNDILTMQTFYGADLTTRTGNTTYGFNSTLAAVDGGIYDFTQNAHPILCIYDAGGNDTIDLSGYSTASNLDLNAGAFSDANSMTKNISIAYTAVIENGTTGAGNDTLTGNSVANILNGGGGDDTFNGGGGGDTFIGGIGTDTVTYASEAAGLTIDMATPGSSTGNAQGDSFNSIEKVIGSGFIDNISGTSGNETIDGGVGNDVLNGRGGNDAIIGGSGTDTVVFSGNFSQYVFNYNSGTQTYTVYNPDGSIDTVTGVETFQFADGAKTTAQLPITVGAPQRHVTIANLTPSQNEGNTGSTTYTFEVRLDGSAFSSQTVNYSIAGNGPNAANAADFSSQLTGTLTFAVGETVKIVTVQVVGDTTNEQNETFALTLVTPSSGLVIDTTSSTSTIVNDDTPSINIINGTASGETLNGTTGVDQINGLAGNDYLDGKGGSDFLFGGDGDDQIVYDAADLAANVNGGNGTDTLVVNGGSLPTGFNLVASSFEKAIWTQTDTGNTQIWSTIANSYDSNWNLTDTTTNNDDGSRVAVTYDAGNAASWSSIRDDYNTTTQHTFQTINLDAGNRYTVSFDTANNLWATVVDYFNTSNQQTDHVVHFDDNSQSTTTYDALGNQTWSSSRADYNAASQLTLSAQTYDSGAGFSTSFDATNSASWATVRDDFDTLNRTIYHTITYDNGSRDSVAYDASNTATWSSVVDYFNTAGQQLTHTINYDNGTKAVVSYDPTNASSWLQIENDYTSSGQQNLAVITYDNTNVEYVIYDYQNQYSWAEQHSVYDNVGNLLNQFYV
jgi:serralysin